jgi:hypothetical protein
MRRPHRLSCLKSQKRRVPLRKQTTTGLQASVRRRRLECEERALRTLRRDPTEITKHERRVEFIDAVRGLDGLTPH